MRNLVLVENPHITSPAARVLLLRRLRKQALQEWLDFRDQYLAEQKALHGDLVCSYCGEPGLLEDVGETPTKTELRKLATVDHIHPLAKGGAEYDKNNFALACHPCNNNKGDKILSVQGEYMHHKRGRSRNQRAGCKMCKSWKISSVSRTSSAFEKHSDHVARISAGMDIIFANNEQGDVQC